jgi:hypothetical protein
VEVTVIYPEGMSILNVQELAGKAWRVDQQDDHHRRGDGEGADVQAFRR